MLFSWPSILYTILPSFLSISIVEDKQRVFSSHNRTPSSCPGYTQYAVERHAPYSGGPLSLPNMRPPPECRTFNSSAVERVVAEMKARLVDPDLAQLFTNAFTSTLDTTVKYFDAGRNLAFITTGDIDAQWLRDTGNQFAHLYKLLPKDKHLETLVKAVINTESRYIAQYPYCGAFQPPRESGLRPAVNDYAAHVDVHPQVDNHTVFECKYELDSLCSFLKISRSYYTNTNDSSFINDNWNDAIEQILLVIEHESQGSWDTDFNFVSYYNWTGMPGSLAPHVTNGGNGEPRLANGLVSSSHRPSDDLCVFNYITSDNAMLSVELAHLADMLDSIGTLPNVSEIARNYSITIRQAILDHTVSSNGIFVYETNGYGGQYIMDDANVPSLLSLPYLGFLTRDDPKYIKTKDVLLSRANPYYAEGKGFTGIGGPHINATYPWPMSQISAIYGSNDDDEIMGRLAVLVNTTGGLGLIHESMHISNSSDFTRPWFAWANSYFAEMILDLAERKPKLIFNSSNPYIIGQP